MSIAYLPLDDRPCNKDFPVLLARLAGDNLRVAQNKSRFKVFLKSSEGSILSIDRWCFGGFVESRKPELTLQEAQRRMRDVQKIISSARKEIYGITVLMRQAPTALTESDQKKAELINIASRLHRNKANFEAILKLIPKHTWHEYLKTRKRNFSVNKKAIEFCKKGWITFLAVGMDDLSPDALNWEEARKLRELLRTDRMKKRSCMLPGADEMGMLLVARKAVMERALSPRIYPIYSHPDPDRFRLRYDGVSLKSILKSQLNLLGARLSTDARKADLFLFLHTPQEDQIDVPLSFPSPHFSYRWFKSLQSFLVREKHCILADLRFANGADSSLMRTLSELAPLSRLYGFSAWNTAANSLGMALSQGVVRWAAEQTNKVDLKTHERILALRILEDWLYQAEIRTEIVKRLRKEGKAVLHLDRQLQEQLSREVAEKLNRLSRTYLAKHFPGLRVGEVSFPWNRLFDIEIQFRI